MRLMSLLMRMVSPFCSIGGLLTISSRRFCGLSKPTPEERTSAWTWTLLSALPVMETLPDALASSRRIGAVTVSVRSKLPLAAGPMAQPVLARAGVARMRIIGAASLWRIVFFLLGRGRAPIFTTDAGTELTQTLRSSRPAGVSERLGAHHEIRRMGRLCSGNLF